MKQNHIKSLLSRYPNPDDYLCGLDAIRRQPSGITRETRESIALARQFIDDVVKPEALKLDRELQEEPNLLSSETVLQASNRGFYTRWIPRILGGGGVSFPSFSHFIEEISSVCSAQANVIGVHYLGLATVMATWNMPLINRICKEIIDGEKKQKPCIVSLALTEPDAGTDMEENCLMDKGRITCHAKKVSGGWSVNGRKIFISNGHLSTWHILFAFVDTQKPSENLILMAIKNGMEGFSFGRKEHKMGQKACVASELIFDNCFVPDDCVCWTPDEMAQLKRSKSQTTMQILDYVLGSSRAGVCAFGTGVARGAFETAAKFASQTKVCDKLLIEHEWAQSILSQMYRNVAISRLAYIEANAACGMYGMYKYLQIKPLYYLMKYLPTPMVNFIAYPICHTTMGTQLFRYLYCDCQTDAESRRVSGWASLAKFTGTDAGVENCQLALQLMGQAGVRHDHWAEKHFRDARLMQIYEGTNQLNRLNVFKCLIAGGFNNVSVFEE
jgi:alkylation response protein AidB-like acyl-CoA dehydrogenase